MAMDNFLEEVATKRNRGAETVMYVLANIMMVVFGLWAFLMLQGIMMLINAGEGAGPIIYYVVMTLLTGGIAVLLFPPACNFGRICTLRRVRYGVKMLISYSKAGMSCFQTE